VASGCGCGMAKGSEMIPRTWPPCWPMPVAMPGSGRICSMVGPGVVAQSFNAITVDGDHQHQRLLPGLCSRPAPEPSSIPLSLEARLNGPVSQHLAKAVARDGEGATCLIEVFRWGASSDATPAPSPERSCGLLPCGKTAVHGASNLGPDRGRRPAALGWRSADAVALWLESTSLDGRPVSPLGPSIAPRVTYLKERAAGAYLTADPRNATPYDPPGRGRWPGPRASAWGLRPSPRPVTSHPNADYPPDHLTTSRTGSGLKDGGNRAASLHVPGPATGGRPGATGQRRLRPPTAASIALADGPAGRPLLRPGIRQSPGRSACAGWRRRQPLGQPFEVKPRRERAWRACGCASAIRTARSVRFSKAEQAEERKRGRPRGSKEVKETPKPKRSGIPPAARGAGRYRRCNGSPR